MELRILTSRQLTDLYNGEMKRAFPPDELKPLKAMEGLRDQGRYDALGLWDGEQLLGYAMMWLEPGCSFALLDYLGIMDGQRDRGLGSTLLTLLKEYYSHYRAIFGEAEAPENGAPEGEPLRRRRLEFYHRNGFRYGGYDCALFGVHYQTLILGGEDVTPEQLLQVHQDIYRGYMPAHIYGRFIQLPLLPGQAVNPAGDWIED
jgi:GNAT superfamily N-acetyltransferase